MVSPNGSLRRSPGVSKPISLMRLSGLTAFSRLRCFNCKAYPNPMGMAGRNAMKSLGLMILLLGAAGSAMAGVPTATPEIDSASAIGALALLSGALLVIRDRKSVV